MGYSRPRYRPNETRRMPITTEQVTQLAPDANSAAAGQKLKAPKNWSHLGSSAEALWGQCQGSALYRVQVELSNLGSSCSCPSRKFPCKHVLGLLFLFADSPAALPPGEPPEWVVEWLRKRQDREQKKAAKAEAPPKSVDEKAQQKRAEQEARELRNNLTHLTRVNTLGALSGSLAHELNQPLGIILRRCFENCLHMAAKRLTMIRIIQIRIIASL